MGKRWYNRWWALDPSMWENSDDPERPVENVVFRNIRIQALKARAIREQAEERKRKRYKDV